MSGRVSILSGEAVLRGAKRAEWEKVLGVVGAEWERIMLTGKKKR